MYVYKEKYIPIIDNFVAIKLGDLYIYMDLQEYRRLYEAQGFEDFPNLDQDRMRNTLKFEKELQEKPLNAIRYYAYLIENNLEEVETLEEYINHVAWLFTKPIVCTSSIEDLIEADMFYQISNLQDVEYAKEKFASNCIQNSNIQIQSVAKVHPTHYVEVVGREGVPNYAPPAGEEIVFDDNSPEWKQMCDRYGEYYTGLGMFEIPGQELMCYDANDTELIEEYLNWEDPYKADDSSSNSSESSIDLSDIKIADETSDGVYEIEDNVMPQHIFDLAAIVEDLNKE